MELRKKKSSYFEQAREDFMEKTLHQEASGAAASDYEAATTFEEFDQLFVGRKRGMKNRGVQTDAQRFMVESTAKQRLRAELEKKSRPQGGPTFEYKMLNKGLNSNKREQAAEEREEAAREALEMGPDKNIRSHFLLSKDQKKSKNADLGYDLTPAQKRLLKAEQADSLQKEKPSLYETLTKNNLKKTRDPNLGYKKNTTTTGLRLK